MPNTIAHFAVAGLITTSLLKKTDLKWIYIACVIPDIPWIMQRLVMSFQFDINRYDVRAYAIVQSSLLCSLILAAAIACCAKDFRRTFITLAIGCLIHLLLDAIQIKWANGVLLLAPIDWKLIRLDWFWPESAWNYALTAAGLCYFIICFKRATDPTKGEFRGDYRYWIASMFGVFLWLTLPLVFTNKVYQNDHHFIATLMNSSERENRLVEFDRNRYSSSNKGNILTTSFGEKITLTKIVASNGDLVSVQGRFLTEKIVEVHNAHIHSNFRDSSTLLGLTLVIISWLGFFIRRYLSQRLASTQ